jgi:hypothetical protein
MVISSPFLSISFHTKLNVSVLSSSISYTSSTHSGASSVVFLNVILKSVLTDSHDKSIAVIPMFSISSCVTQEFFIVRIFPSIEYF